MDVRSFFMMDENFLFHRKRALRLLELMEAARQVVVALRLQFGQRAPLVHASTNSSAWASPGCGWASKAATASTRKLTGIDTFELVRELQSHGIRVLGSTIIGLENHTPENIDEAIDYAARHDTDFHQFMLYTPIPGTPLHAELTAKGLMKDESEYHLSDIHGQLIFNYRHPPINDEQSAEFMLRAFDRDFERNGPSTVRIVRTTLAGWQRYKNHPDARVRDRYAWEAREIGHHVLRGRRRGEALLPQQSGDARQDVGAAARRLHAEFGWKSRLSSALGGRWVLRKIRKEEKRLAAGWTYEPPTFYERNAAVTGSAGGRSVPFGPASKRACPKPAMSPVTDRRSAESVAV